MKISKTHQRLANHFGTEEVLTNPEPFLGPNWETVLRFWLYYESLTLKQKNKLRRRKTAIDDDTYNRAWALAYNTATEVIGENNRSVMFMVAPITAPITYELISMHILFERGHSLTFVPLIKDL
jgi:hypothetical protein